MRESGIILAGVSTTQKSPKKENKKPRVAYAFNSGFLQVYDGWLLFFIML